MNSLSVSNCRLCGYDARIVQSVFNDDERVAYVECRGLDCGCAGPMIRFSADPAGRPHIEAERIAVERWNELHKMD